MKYLLVIPDGVGIRNFLCTRFIDLLLTTGEVSVWHALPEESLAVYQKKWGEGVRWRALPQRREGLCARVLRQAKVHAQLYCWKERREDVMVFKPQGRWLNLLTWHAARLLARAAAGKRRIVWLDKLHAFCVGQSQTVRELKTLLSEERADVLFCTHQRSSLAVPLMLAARKLRIPTSTFIYSWDNLPKGRMAVHADAFLVWSEYMKEELLSYYPEVRAEQVRVVGTPQFEHYFNPALVRPRADFLRELGLDPHRPVICFSGDDVTTSPYDEQYLADLAEALRRAPAETRPQILFRRCPADTSDRYRPVLEKYPEISVSEPLWSRTQDGDWSQVVPTEQDVALLVNIVHHCDLVVNVGSTMAMDFAILDKPGIYLAYDPAQALERMEERADWSVREIYRLPHFRMVHKLQPVYWARSAEGLGPLVAQVLSHASEKEGARRAWLREQVALPLEGASARCHQALCEIGGAYPEQMTSPLVAYGFEINPPSF